MGRQKLNRALGMFVILLTGLIHIYNVPGEYQDAPYMGVLFFVFFLASIISAIGIYHDQLKWGWLLGGALAVGAIFGYLISRTIGLPISGKEAWGPPLAYFSLFLEVLFFVPLTLFSSPYIQKVSRQ